jgi:superfamily II DNA/RNA helicase
MVVRGGEKVYALLHLLQSLHATAACALVFTASARPALRTRLPRRSLAACAQIEGSRRLFSLLRALHGQGLPIGRCQEYSSLLSHASRSAALAAFARRESTVLVASDAATRGLDVEVRSRGIPFLLGNGAHLRD